MSTDILMPMFYMVVLTSVVFLFNVLIRLKDVLVDKGHTGSELMKIPIPSSANDLIKQADRNLINLFEFPILFYAVCIAIYMTGRVDPLFLSLAYSFVGLRVASMKRRKLSSEELKLWEKVAKSTLIPG